MRQQGLINETGGRTVNFDMANVKPITDNQRVAFNYWDQNYHLVLHGIAGTGKTFLGLYFALNTVLDKSNDYNKVYVIRSTVSSRDQGFLPGTQKQKEAAYEEPYPPICSELFGRGDSYEILKQKDLLEFRSSSFLRGVTFKDCIIVVDEVQNMTFQELDTIMTRVGENCRIVFCGDVKQDDLTSERKKEYSGLKDFLNILNRMPEFEFVDFQIEDIVRSKLVKSYIIQKDKLGL